MSETLAMAMAMAMAAILTPLHECQIIYLRHSKPDSRQMLLPFALSLLIEICESELAVSSAPFDLNELQPCAFTVLQQRSARYERR